jgi:hypothetical protein
MAKIKREGPGSIILEVTSDMIQKELLEVCVVATVLLTSGYSLEWPTIVIFGFPVILRIALHVSMPYFQSSLLRFTILCWATRYSICVFNPSLDGGV